MMMNANSKLLKLVINMATRLDSLTLSTKRSMYEYYVLQSGSQYIAFDDHSGGWPYETSFSGAKKYSTLEAALEAVHVKPQSKVMHCVVYGEIVSDSDINFELRKSALSKLTPEEIRALGLGE